MNLPAPEETLADCCWLPRLSAKARALMEGTLPRSYRLAFGSLIGVDGYFLRHFQISRKELLSTVEATASDEELAHWFLAQPEVTAASIAEWNEMHPSLARNNTPAV